MKQTSLVNPGLGVMCKLCFDFYNHNANFKRVMNACSAQCFQTALSGPRVNLGKDESTNRDSGVDSSLTSIGYQKSLIPDEAFMVTYLCE